jgi:hypothetical protein
MKTTTAVTSAARTPTEAELVKLRKRIGSTTYVVSVRFSDKAPETLEDIILRLIESEVRHSA